MTLSVIIPTWSGTYSLADAAITLCKQVRSMCDELIVTEDGPIWKELESLADKFLSHPRLGHIENLRLGITVASGDFIAMVDSDVVIETGSIRDLCVPGKLVIPVYNQGIGLIVSPRELLEEFPLYQLPLGYEGIDRWWAAFQERYKNITISSSQVRYNHYQNKSYTELTRWVTKKEEIVYNSHPAKEIDKHRHEQRMKEDPAYYAEWIDKEY